MAERRMFARSIVESARFLKMPATSQCLYFHLGMHADDDGAVEAYPVMNMVKANEDDLRVLVAKGFVVVLNEDLVTYIKDWQNFNVIRYDRKKDSVYKNLILKVLPEVDLIQRTQRADMKKKSPEVLESTQSEYGQTLDGPRTVHGQTLDSEWTAQCSVGKYSLGKDSIVKDSIEECSVVPGTHTVLYTLGNESLTEAEYQELVKAFSPLVVDSVINRILNKPY